MMRQGFVFFTLIFLSLSFSVKSYGGPPLSLPERYQTIEGRPVSIKKNRYAVFIAYGSRCPIMRKYMPTINDLEKRTEFRQQKIPIYLLFQQGRETTDELMKERRDFHILPLMLLDPDNALTKSLGLTISSEAALVDMIKGEVIYKGAINNGINFDLSTKATKHYLLEAIKAVNSGKKPEVTSTKAYGCYL